MDDKWLMVRNCDAHPLSPFVTQHGGENEWLKESCINRSNGSPLLNFNRCIAFYRVTKSSGLFSSLWDTMARYLMLSHL